MWESLWYEQETIVFVVVDMTNNSQIDNATLLWTLSSPIRMRIDIIDTWHLWTHYNDIYIPLFYLYMLIMHLTFTSYVHNIYYEHLLLHRQCWFASNTTNGNVRVKGCFLSMCSLFDVCVCMCLCNVMNQTIHTAHASTILRESQNTWLLLFDPIISLVRFHYTDSI